MEAGSEKTWNDSSLSKRLTNNRKTVEISDGKKTKPYRLTIQIDKIYLRPCPRSKKINQININAGSAQKEAEEKLQNLKCLVCKKKFSTMTKLYEHSKEHFICDICNTEFSSQKSIKKHSKIHQSENSLQPYQCHICGKLFHKKESIRNHPHIQLDTYNDIDDNRIQYCKTCNMSFKNETVFRKHLASHVETSDLQINDQKLPSVNSTNLSSLRPVSFNCRICNQKFDNITDIDKHTKNHVHALESTN